MTEQEIVEFLRRNIQPIPYQNYGDGFCASVTLRDGTHLPCVIFKSSQKLVDLAIQRFKEEKSGIGIFRNFPKMYGYREIVKNFVARGNCISPHDILEVSESKFAIPLNVRKQIHGETAMSWTAFVLEFENERKLSFGTDHHLDFFDLPHDYDFKNVTKVLSGAYLSKENMIVPHRSAKDIEKMQPIYREKPFFECFLDFL